MKGFQGGPHRKVYDAVCTGQVIGEPVGPRHDHGFFVLVDHERVLGVCRDPAAHGHRRRHEVASHGGLCTGTDDMDRILVHVPKKALVSGPR